MEVGILSGFAELTIERPCFLLPLFRIDGSKELFAQIYKTRGVVEGFIVASEAISINIDKKSMLAVTIGQQPIVGALDFKGERVAFGLRDEIFQNLRQMVSHPDASDAFKLSVYELMGDNDVARHYRDKSLEGLADSLGSLSASAFRNSLATDKLWEILEGCPRNEESKDRFIVNRGSVSARINNGKVDVFLGLMSEEDFTRDVTDIAKEILREYRGISKNEGLLRKADLSNLGGTDPAYGDFVAAVNRATRQEERIAIAVRSLLLSPRQGMHILESFSFPSRYESWARGLILNAVKNVGEDENKIEIAISSIIRNLISQAYPMRKGEAIFYLAEHLSDFPRLRAQIEAAFVSSRALSVQLLRTQIEAALNRKNSVA